MKERIMLQVKCFFLFVIEIHFHISCLAIIFNADILLFFYLGRPQPEVRWLINGVLVDDECEQNSGDVIENRLLWPSIARNDLNSVFTCQALNTILVEPKETSFVLDMNCKYSKIFVCLIVFSI